MIIQTTKFWVVTKPTRRSTLADICFVCDISGLTLQFKGGLQASEIEVIFFDKDAQKNAEKVARDLLEVVR